MCEGSRGHQPGWFTQWNGLQARRSPLPPQGEWEGDGPIAGNWREQHRRKDISQS